MDVEVDAALAAAVSRAVGRAAAPAGRMVRAPLDYDAFLAHRSVSRLSGEAVVGGTSVPWTLIEKRTEGAALASPYLLDNATRELEAYRSGLLDELPTGIRAPLLYGAHVDERGGIALWLEEVGHEGARPLDSETIVRVARDLGAMNGRWVGRGSREPWLFGGWIDRHGQPEAVERGLATLRRRHPRAVARLGHRLERAERLVLAQRRVGAIARSLPHTLCHHDAVGANVFREAAGTVLVDWESVGPGPVGADLASLLFSSVRRGDASARTVAGIIDAAVDGYAEGLGREAPEVSTAVVRRGLDAAIALRWKAAVDVVAGAESGEPPRRGSLPDEQPEAAEGELIILVDILLDAAERILDRD
jgi:hypothetical protein